MEDVIHDIQVIEEDVKDVEQKCKKVNCYALYDAIVATIKLIYDILFLLLQEKGLKINNNIINFFNSVYLFCVCFFGLFDLFLFGHLI